MSAEPVDGPPDFSGGHRHGTSGGYQQHHKLGIPMCRCSRPDGDDEVCPVCGLCAICRPAARAYRQQYRKRNGTGKDLWYDRTRALALRELAKNHQAEMRQIVARIRAEQPYQEPEP